MGDDNLFSVEVGLNFLIKVCFFFYIAVIPTLLFSDQLIKRDQRSVNLVVKASLYFYKGDNISSIPKQYIYYTTRFHSFTDGNIPSVCG